MSRAETIGRLRWSTHNAVALQHRTFGLGIVLLTRWLVVSSAIALPTGLFVLVRRLVPTRPLAAGFTSLVSPFLAMFPYHPAAWSAITLIVGMASVPATIVLVGRAGDAVRDRGDGSSRRRSRHSA